ncbi:MAG: hypothetical protein Q7V57_01170 [Actinomycetota bacterium]|nr:hypothetical protein [Actinomycetota bacterium]
MRKYCWYIGVLSLATAGMACSDDGDSTITTDTVGTIVVAEPIDLLYISDSSGWGVAEEYARLAEEQLGRTVNVIDWRVGGLSLVEAIAEIDRRPEVVATAEIIVLEGNPFGSGVREGFGECMNKYATASPGRYTVDDFAPYQTLFEEALAKIAAARGNEPTAVRVTDIYSADPTMWVALGLDADCRTIWAAQSEAITKAATAGGAVFVSTYDVYNGPSHDEDPVAKGFVRSDRIHPSNKGAAAMAQALAAIGFAELTDS